MADLSETWTFFNGAWHEGNVAMIGPRTHGLWLGGPACVHTIELARVCALAQDDCRRQQLVGGDVRPSIVVCAQGEELRCRSMCAHVVRLHNARYGPRTTAQHNRTHATHTCRTHRRTPLRGGSTAGGAAPIPTSVGRPPPNRRCPHTERREADHRPGACRPCMVRVAGNKIA